MLEEIQCISTIDITEITIKHQKQRIPSANYKYHSLPQINTSHNKSPHLPTLLSYHHRISTNKSILLTIRPSSFKPVYIHLDSVSIRFEVVPYRQPTFPSDFSMCSKQSASTAYPASQYQMCYNLVWRALSFLDNPLTYTYTFTYGHSSLCSSQLCPFSLDPLRAENEVEKRF